MNRTMLSLLLDKLEEMIDSAPEIPFTGRSIIDGDQALELIARIREGLPPEKPASSDGEEHPLIAEARREAERIVAEARAYAAKLVDEHEVLRQAREEAERILEEARQRARELEEGADRYAEDVLDRLQSSLERTLQVVQKGREELRR